MTDNLAAIIAAVIFAAATAVFAVLYLRERKRCAQQLAELGASHAEKLSELEASGERELERWKRESEIWSGLAAQLDKSLAEGERPVFAAAWDKSGRRLMGSSMADAKQSGAMEGLLNGEELSAELTDGGHVFSAQRSSGAAELLLVRDISDMRALEELKLRQEEEARRREGIDPVTGTLSPSAFLERAWSIFEGEEPVRAACAVYLDSAYGRKMNPGVAIGTGEGHLRDLAAAFWELGDKAIFTRCDDTGLQGFIYGCNNYEELHATVRSLYSAAEAAVERRAPAGEEASRMVLGVAWYPTDSSSLPELLNNARAAALDARDKGLWGLASYCDDTPKPPEELTEPVDKRMAKVLLQPVASASDARVWGYEICLRSRSSAYPGVEGLFNALDDEGKRKLEKLMWFEGMKSFISLQSKGLVPYGAKLIIRSTPGVILSDRDAREFEERFYDYLNRLVIQIDDGGWGYYSCAEIKSRRAAAWGAVCALELRGDSRSDSLARIVARPDLIRVGGHYIRGIGRSQEKQEALAALVAELKARGNEIFVSDIETAAELKAAVKQGASLLQGSYIAKAEAQPADLTEKRISEIGEAQYG